LQFLDSETLTVSGGTGLDSSATGNAVTLAIDSTVTTLTGSQTLTNKTLSSLNDGTITATAFVDEDNMVSNSATLIPTQQSVKAYVDTTVAATNEVVEDTTPQLGGDLDLNSNDITGTGNINITGTIQSSGNITGTLATAAQPNITSVGTLTGLTTSADINFGDNDKAIFGTGSDLQIYHSGTNSIISEEGTGVLEVRTNGTEIQVTGDSGSDYMARFVSNGKSQLHYDGSPKLETTSTGIDVTGTVTADGLTIDGTALVRADSTTIQLRSDDGTSNGYNIKANVSDANDFGFIIEDKNQKDLLKIQSNNDISFYENTGTTAALFWDASAERLGIGTTTPDAPLDVVAPTTNSIYASFSSTDTRPLQLSSFNTASIDAGHNFNVTSGNGAVSFSIGGAEAMRIDSAGNVGIDTDSPNQLLSINSTGSGERGISFDQSGAERVKLLYTNSTGGFVINNTTTGYTSFENNGSESVRIDSSGNVGIGTTSPSVPLHIETLSTSGTGTPTEVLRLQVTESPEISDLVAGDGTKLSFYVPEGNQTTQEGAAIAALRESSSDANAATSLTFYTAGDDTAVSEAMRIDSSGNVGIGTDSPNRELELAAANPRFRITDTDGGYSEISGNGGHLTLQADAGNTQGGTRIVYEIDADEKMRIDSNGQLLVGGTTSSPSNVKNSHFWYRKCKFSLQLRTHWSTYKQ